MACPTALRYPSQHLASTPTACRPSWTLLKVSSLPQSASCMLEECWTSRRWSLDNASQHSELVLMARTALISPLTSEQAFTRIIANIGLRSSQAKVGAPSPSPAIVNRHPLESYTTGRRTATPSWHCSSHPRGRMQAISAPTPLLPSSLLPPAPLRPRTTAARALSPN